MEQFGYSSQNSDKWSWIGKVRKADEDVDKVGAKT